MVEVGEGVKDFKPGDRVMGRSAHAFSELAMFRASDAMKAPAKLDWVTAAGASIAYLTAYDMLWPGGELKADEWLLVAGASAGVGVASVQLGKLVGAKVIGTSGSAEKLQKLAALGLDVGLQKRNGGFEKDVMQATGGKGVNLVVKQRRGTCSPSACRLAYRGRLATVAMSTGSQGGDGNPRLHAKRLKLFGVSNKMRSAAEVAEGVARLRARRAAAIASGHLNPVIDKVVSVCRTAAGQGHMESNAHLGNHPARRLQPLAHQRDVAAQRV